MANRNVFMGVSWQGIDALDLRIDKLIGMAESHEITQALRPGAELIAERWRQLVPVATGRYKDHIHVEEGDADEFGINSFIIYTDAVNDDGYPYPEALEYGTSIMGAQPSARPAFDENAEAAVALAVAYLDALVLQALSR